MNVKTFAKWLTRLAIAITLATSFLVFVQWRNTGDNIFLAYFLIDIVAANILFQTGKYIQNNK